MANAIIGNVFVQGQSVGVALGNANPSKGVYVEFEPNEVVYLPPSASPRMAFYTYPQGGAQEIRWWEDDEVRPAMLSTDTFVPAYTLVTYVTPPEVPLAGSRTRLKCLETAGSYAGMARICEFDTEILPLIQFADDPLI
jgi:hypothetical protein